MNESSINNLTQIPKIKPLDSYISELKSRNMVLGKVIPALDKTVENVATYDDLYKRLIDESYLICNELVNTRNLHSGQNSDRELEKVGLGGNVERALIFSSMENINKQNEKTRNSANLLTVPKIQKFSPNTNTNTNNYNTANKLSPIPVPDNKSGFYSNMKNLNTEGKPYLQMSNYENAKSGKNDFQTDKNPLFMHDDFMLLIKSAKEIEKTIEENNPVKKLEQCESKINRQIRKVEDVEKIQSSLVEDKQEINFRLNEMNSLLAQFEERFNKLDEYMTIKRKNIQDVGPLMSTSEGTIGLDYDTYLNPNINIPTNNDTKLKEQNKTFTYPEKSNYSTNPENYLKTWQTRSNIKIKEEAEGEEENQENSNQNNVRSKYYTINSRDSVLTTELTRQINSLFSEGKISQAGNLWKEVGYDKFRETTYDRSYEMLVQLVKFKDRELALLEKKGRSFDDMRKEASQKDAEMVELFAELEYCKNTLKSMDYLSKTNAKSEQRIANLIQENAILYKDNVKLKTLLQRQSYFQQRGI